MKKKREEEGKRNMTDEDLEACIERNREFLLAIGRGERKEKKKRR